MNDLKLEKKDNNHEQEINLPDGWGVRYNSISSEVGFYCEKCDDGESTYCELELDVIVKSADIVLEYDPDTLREA